MDYEMIRYKYYNSIKIDLEDWKCNKTLIEQGFISSDQLFKMYKDSCSALRSYWISNTKNLVIPNNKHPLINAHNRLIEYRKILSEK